MPGLLLCFVLRYDTYKKLQTASAEAGVPPPLTYVQRITYFHCSLLGYFLGRCKAITLLSYVPYFFLLYLLLTDLLVGCVHINKRENT